MYSSDELIDIFNSLLQQEITRKTEFRHKVISNGCEHLNMCGGGMISIWVNIDRCLVAQDTEKAFKDEIEEAGWNIVEYVWQKDERTHLDQILIRIKPSK